MSTTENKDLGYLGEEFQIRLIHALMDDKDFFRDIISIVNQNMFTNATYRTYVAFIKEYYEKYETIPSYKVMEMYINGKITNPIDRERLQELNNIIPSVTPEAIEHIRDTATKFFKQQNIVRVANEILDIASKGNTEQYESIVEKVNEAVNIGIKEYIGEDVFANIEETLSPDSRKTIPTGIESLDKTLEGGIGKGELGLIIAPSGIGKSSMTTAIAANAAVSGFKVLQIVFEDRVKQIQKKHIGRITGIEARNLGKPEFRTEILKKLEEYEDKESLKNNLRIVRFPTGEITAQYIENYIKKLTNGGFKPDLVVIDYFECLNHVGDKSMTEWEREGKTMRKLEAMSGQMDIAFWIPTQGSRDSISSEVVTMDKAGGSLKKVQIAHIIISIARSQDDIINNRATIALLKNRSGCSGKIWNNVYFNNGTCIINTDDASEFGSSIAFDDFKDKSVEQTTKELIKRMKQKKDV